jgi:hypothetical protein
LKPETVDFFIAYREWITGSRMQMRAFEKRVGNDFIMTAPGHPDIRARLASFRLSEGNGRFQAFGAKILPADESKVAPGVAYTLKPINTNNDYVWVAPADLAPIVLR